MNRVRLNSHQAPAPGYIGSPYALAKEESVGRNSGGCTHRFTAGSGGGWVFDFVLLWTP